MPLNEPSLINIVIIVSVSFGLLLIGVIITYFWLIRKYLSLEHEKVQNQAQISAQSQKLIQDAQASATQIVKDATIKAEAIIKGAQDISTNQQQVIAQALETQSQKYIAVYQQSLKSIEGQILTAVKGAPEDIKKGIQAQIDLVGQELAKELAGTQNQFRVAMDTAYKNMQADLENYKKAKMAKVDESIMDAVEEIAKEVVARSIPVEDHEELILKSLEQAKKEGLFN